METLEEEFTTPENVRKWLVDDRRVPQRVAGAVAPTLFEGSYIYPSSLLNIPRNDLDLLDISPPHKNILFNKLRQQPQPQQQQPDDTMATLTVEYFKKNYESLKDIPDDDLANVLHRLKEDWITTTTSLESVSRDGLIQKNYPLMFVNALKPEEVFVVGALVRGAKQSNGARGNVFKFLQRANGYYSMQEGIQIFYEQDDLSVKAYFMSHDSACGFQNALNEWEIHKELVNLHGITLDPPSPAEIERPIDLVRIYMQDYKPQDSESPCHSIDQLHSFRISIPLTTAVDATSPIGKYQCLDKQIVGFNPYKCHLKDKAKFKSLQKNENNMVAASWELHQQMDGLNSIDGIPGVALSVADTGNERIAEHDNRIMVRLNLEFRNTYLAGRFQGNGMPLRVDDTNWQITVYVEDSDTFCDCVRWKHADTKKQWEDHERFLNTV